MATVRKQSKHAVAKQATVKSTDERIDMLKSRRDAALAIAKHFGPSDKRAFSEVNQLQVASLMNEALAELDSSEMLKTFKKCPKQLCDFARVIIAQGNEQSRREKLELDFQKYRDEVAKAKEAITSAAKQQNGLSEDTLKTIEEATKLL